MESKQQVLDLFDEQIYHCEDGLECNNCGIVQPINNFQHMLAGEIKRKCRTCSRNQSALLKHLKKKHLYPADDYVCTICERGIDEIGRKGQKRLQNWVVDHCHDTETFRGWLCHHCNVGLGSFADNLDRLKRAATYLESHERKVK
tara:strand:- start:85 stop:519 length:435 start_codon:yes stop_codon:yes gene_type:complete